jgi:putative sterol carrier protein
MVLPDGIIKMAISKVISKSNEKIDFESLISNTGSIHDVDKKLVIRITDMKSACGIGIKEGKMVEVDKVDKPDTVFSMDKNCFSAILLNKLDHRQAFFLGAIEADGESWVRDSILLAKIFDEIRKAMGVTK